MPEKKSDYVEVDEVVTGSGKAMPGPERGEPEEGRDGPFPGLGGRGVKMVSLGRGVFSKRWWPLWVLLGGVALVLGMVLLVAFAVLWVLWTLVRVLLSPFFGRGGGGGGSFQVRIR